MCSGASCLHFVDRASCSEGSELQEGPDSGQSDPSVDDLSSCCSLLKVRERQCHGELTPGWLWRSPMLWSLQEKGCRCPAGRSHRAGRTCSPGGPEPSLAGPQAPRGPAPLLLAPGFPHLLWHSAFFIVQLSHPYMTIGKTIALARQTFVGKVMSLLFNMLSRLSLLSFKNIYVA